MENQYSYYEQGSTDANGYYQGYHTDQNSTGGRPPKRKKRIPKLLTVVGCGILFGIVASATFLSVNVFGSRLLGIRLTGNLRETKTLESAKNNTASLTTSAGTVTSDVSAIVENAMPSVVSITNMSIQQVQNFFGQIGTQELQSSGSGIIVAQNDSELLIVTNNHVVEGSDTLTVTFHDNSSLEADIKGTDSTPRI